MDTKPGVEALGRWRPRGAQLQGHPPRLHSDFKVTLLRQEDQKLKTSLGYTVRPHLKIQVNKRLFEEAFCLLQILLLFFVVVIVFVLAVLELAL